MNVRKTNISDDFIRDLNWAIGDVIDKHSDACFSDIKSGLFLWLAVTEGAVLAAAKYVEYPVEESGKKHAKIRNE